MPLGSPPHVRGKVQKGQAISLIHGITPACAGKRLAYSCSKNLVEDHPRMCGEKLKFIAVAFSMWGSPPHVRGKVCFVPFPLFYHGITPACAGKRPKAAHRGRSCRDHPRMCGEKAQEIGKSLQLQGSPPHVRGKVQLKALRFGLTRITPACAGKRTYKRGRPA